MKHLYIQSGLTLRGILMIMIISLGYFPLSAQLYSYDFNAGAMGWTSAVMGGTNCGGYVFVSNMWGNQAFGHAGASMGTTSVGGENSYIVSPVLSLPATFTLSFWSYQNNETGYPCYYDVENVDYSTDGGTTWIPFFTTLQPSLHSTSVTWVNCSYNATITPTANGRIRFHYDTGDGCCGGTGTNNGWYVDDVTITDAGGTCTGTPVGGAATATPTSFCAAPAYISLNNTSASTGGGITYKWQSSATGATYANIPGASTLTYTATATASTYYRLMVKCTASGLISYSSPVYVPMTGTTEVCNAIDDDCDGAVDDGVVESISIYAAGLTAFCMGESVNMYASYTGTSLQWKRDGADIPGATDYFYTAMYPGVYTCLTTSACGSALSTGITVTVYPKPNASISAGGPTAFCAGSSVTLTEVSSPSSSYQWFKDGSTIAGATGTSYVAYLAGNYKCRVTKTATGCFKNSNTITVEIVCKEGELSENTEMFIHPNPASSELTVSLNTFNSQPLPFTITDLTGKIIYSSELNSPETTIDISLFAAGIYFISVQNNKQILESKFIKN